MMQDVYDVDDQFESPASRKTPPQDFDAEQTVLANLIYVNEIWYSIADRVSEQDFYHQKHKFIFRAIKFCAEENQAYDTVIISNWLKKHNQLDVVGGSAYLLDLFEKRTGSTKSTVHHADIVRESSVLRQLIKVGNEIANSALQTKGLKVSELLDKAEKLVFEIAEQGARGQKGFTVIESVISSAMKRIETLYESAGATTGIATGFKDFDNLTSGLQNSDLIIIAGRPSMGKTAFAMNIAEYVAVEQNIPVAMFSMEMSNEQLGMRLLASIGRVELQRVRTGHLDDDDWPKISYAISQLASAPLYIDDTAALSPMDLRARVRRLAREISQSELQLGLVIIDYLQLMQVPDNKENRALEVSEISRSLKALAKEMNIPVIALSQLNRSLEQRTDKRPVMSDLRESGSLEQDSDLIAFIYRDEVYNENSEDKGIAEIVIRKQRNGPTGTNRLTFLGQFTKFENFADDQNQYQDYS